MQLAWKQTLGFALATLLTLSSLVSAQDESAKDESATGKRSSMVLKNATIHSMGDQGTFVGDILVADGKIKAIGESIKVPESATVYDLQGFHVVPGLIESRGKLWLTSSAISESNTKAELNVLDAIDPWSEDWRELASQGITTVYVQPNSSSSLGGYGAVLRVGPSRSSDHVVLKKDAAIQAAIGIRGATSKDRLTQFKALEKLLESAKEKKKETKPDAKKKSADKTDAKPDDKSTKAEEKKGDSKGDQEKESKGSKRDSKESPESKKDEERDPTKIALRRVLSKEIPLHIEVHHSDALTRVIELAKKYKIRVVLDGLSQVESQSTELLESDIPMVVGPFIEQGATPTYRKNGSRDWLSRDLGDGRLWAISGFPTSARASRWLRIQAAAAIRSGVDPEVALAAVTSNAARMLGVGDVVGTLEIGKQADIAVFAGDPLDPSTPTRMVMSQGEITFESQAVVETHSSTDSVSLPNRLPEQYAVKTTCLLIDGAFTESTLVIADGKIVSVGENADVDDIRVFDLGDTIVTPGLVVASSSLGQAAAINDTMESDASHLRSVDAVDPTTKPARKMLAGGFIHVGLSPGRTNTSAGVVGHVRLGSGNYVADPAIAGQLVLAKSARKNDRFPSSLNGQIQLISGLFQGHSSSDSVYVSSAIRRSIQHDKLSNIKSLTDHERIAIIVADSNLEIRSAISLAKKQNLSPVLVSSGRVGEMAEKLADQKFSLIVAPVGDIVYDAQFQQILTAYKAGVPVAFGGDDPEKIRITAALLVNAGVPREAVLAGLTHGGGDMVGMKNIGLESGAPADFVVWSGSPLDLSSKALNVVVDGQTVTPK